MHPRAWHRITRASATVASLVLAMSAPVAPAAAVTPPELVVDITVASPCPSRITCTHDLHLEWPGGTTDLAITGDGPARDEVRPARFTIAPGEVRISLSSFARTLDATGIDNSATSAEELGTCELTTMIADGAATALVHGLVSFSPDRVWTCELSDAPLPPTPPEQGTVVPMSAVICDLGAENGGISCQRAAAAAQQVRRALAVAPLAVGVPFCLEPGACRAPAFAIAFATREGDVSPWSEPYYVITGRGIPVVDWPAGTPIPQALLDLEAGHADRVGGLLGASVPIQTHASDDCLEAAIVGRLVADPATGIAIGDATSPRQVVWPAGWTAREGLEGRVLIDAAGETVAREGELVQLGGGPDVDGRWAACGEMGRPPIE